MSVLIKSPATVVLCAVAFFLGLAQLAYGEIENLPITEQAPERPVDAEDTPHDDADASSEPQIAEPLPTDQDTTQCETALRKLGVTYEMTDPVIGKAGCGVAKPFRVLEIVPGVTVQPETQLRCDTVLATAQWINRVVLPATEALEVEAGKSVELTSIQHGSTYVCRRRNNLPTGRLSEHARGNAIDIVSFAFEGREPISVEPRKRSGTIEEAFQATVRAGACLDFTTVLGPGSDGFHDDHIHLDIASRRGNYRLCQ